MDNEFLLVENFNDTETLEMALELENIEIDFDALFNHKIGDDALENAGGDMRIVMCSCRPCTSKCSQGSR